MTAAYGGEMLGATPAGVGSIIDSAPFLRFARRVTSPSSRQGGGRYSVAGHAAVMKKLVADKRWDDADQEIRDWFAAGMGSDDERARFHPHLPLVLKSGKANYSLVARYGHQSAVVTEVAKDIASGKSVPGPIPPAVAPTPAVPVAAGLFGMSSKTLVIVGVAVAVLYVLSKKRRRHAS